MKRTGGRKLDELRKINIQRGFNRYAEGSCLIEVGNTKIICTATAEKMVPLFLKGSGQGWVSAEYRMLPRSTHTRTQRDKISGRNMEIQRLIGRALRSVVALSKIGERKIMIDCDVIQADGGTRVASVVGGFVALVDCLKSLKKDGLIDKLHITDFLGAISVGMRGGKAMLDLTYDEDSNIDVDMNIVMKGSGEFMEVQGSGERSSFSQEELKTMIDLGRKGIEEIIDIERNLFKDILPEIGSF